MGSRPSDASTEGAAAAASQERTNKRATHTRSKLGCKVCRIRRIRCDLTRPACLRCTTTGRQCEGYPVTSVAVTGLAERTPAGGLPPLLPSRQSGPGAFPGLNPTGHRSLSFFQQQTADQLSGYFEDAFWKTVVMQMVQREECVRGIVVALGSIHESLHLPPHEAAQTENGVSRVALLETRADREYTKAVSLLNAHLNKSGWAGLEVTLTCALLCIYFEYLRGRHTGGYAHMRSSLLILSKWHEGSVPLHNRGTTPWSPSGHLIRATLWPIFTTLALQGCTMTSLGPVPRWPMSRDTPNAIPRWTGRWSGRGPPPLVVQPGEQPRFKSLAQASQSLDLLMADFPPGGYDGEDIETFDDDGVAQARPEKWSMERRLSLFTEAFDAFLATHLPTAAERPQIELMRLWVCNCQYFLMYAEDGIGNEVAYDRVADKMGQVIDRMGALLAEEAASSSPPPPPTGISTSLRISATPMLYGNAIKCRHPVYRRRAISLLKSLPPSPDDIFNPTMAWMLASKIVAYEEEGAIAMAGGSPPLHITSERDIPPAARVCDMPIKIDLEGGRVRFKLRRQGSNVLSPEMSVSWKFNNKPVGEWPRGARPSSTKFGKTKSYQPAE